MAGRKAAGLGWFSAPSMQFSLGFGGVFRALPAWLLGLMALLASVQDVHAQAHPGLAVYTITVNAASCVDCHAADGGKAFTVGDRSLKINDAAFRSRVSSKAAIINTFLNGQTMGSRTAGLSNQNIANVINYVYSQLNTPVIAQTVSATEVAGAKTFNATCSTAGCHGKTGGGNLVVPQLEGAAFLAKPRADVLEKVLKGGTASVTSGGNTFTSTMPAYESSLTSSQLAEVMTYIYESINGLAPVVEDGIALRFTSGSLTASIDEDTGNGQTALGTRIGTVSIVSGNSPAYSIVTGADGAIFGIDSSTGVLTLNVATAFNHEVKDAYTINLRVVVASKSNNDQFVLNINDLDEAPFFAEDFPDQQVTDVPMTLTLYKAVDLEGDELTYTAARINPAGALPHAGVSLVAASRELVIGVAAVSGTTMTVQVKAAQSGDSSKVATDDFQLEIDLAAGIIASPSGTPITRTGFETVVMRLSAAPSSRGVTLTMTSGTDIGIAPESVTFIGSTWAQAQTVTMSIKAAQAGTTDKGSRQAKLTIAVHVPIQAANNYRRVNAKVVSAEVSIYNADPFVSNDDRVHGFAESIRITRPEPQWEMQLQLIRTIRRAN